MFVAKPLCFLFFTCGKHIPHPYHGSNPSNLPKAEFRHKLLLALSGGSEVLLMALGYLSLTMTAAGVYQMLNGTILIWSFLLSLIYLKRKFIWLHYLAIFLVIAGLALVGASSIVWGAQVYFFVMKGRFIITDKLYRIQRKLLLQLSWESFW